MVVLIPINNSISKSCSGLSPFGGCFHGGGGGFSETKKNTAAAPQNLLRYLFFSVLTLYGLK